MITKTLTANGSKGHHKFQLYVEESKTDTNNSYMTFNFKIMPIQTSWNWEQFGNITYSVKIGDNTYTGGIPNYDGYSTVTLKSGSNIKIPHNADGTKTINISFSVVDKSSARYTCGNASSSASLTLSMLHKPPIYSSYTLTENNSKLSGLGANTIVTNMSNTTIKTNWTLYDGATINSIEVFNANGTKISPSNSISGASVTSTFNFSNIAVPTSGGKTSFKFKITDSMGATCEYTISNINVIVYNEPRIIPTQTSVKRNGQLTGKVTLNLKGTFSNKTIANTTNNITMQFKYWRSGTTEPSTYFDIPSNVISKSGDNISINKWNMAKSGTVISDVHRDYNYKFKIKISDSFGYVNIVELTCPKGMWIMCRFKDRVDFNRATIQGKEVLTNNMDADFNSIKIKGQLVETNTIQSGSNSNGNWIKFSDGTLIQYGKINYGEVSFPKVDSVYYAVVNGITFPIAFVNDNLSVSTNIQMGNIGAVTASNITNSGCGSFNIISATSVTRLVTISWQAVGRWK